MKGLRIKIFFCGLNIIRCRRMLIFVSIQYVLAFMILHANVEAMYTLYEKRNYVRSDSQDNVLWLNGVVSSYVQGDDEEDFYELISELKKIDYVEDIGFTKQTSAILDNDKHSTILLSIDKTYGAWKYRLSKGNWFDFDSDETQFILGGNAKRNRNIGDVINLKIPIEDDDHRIVFEDHTGVIVGFLPEKAYTVDLNYASSDPEFDDMLTSHDSVILTNNSEILNGKNCIYPNVSLLIRVVEGEEANAKQSLEKYGDVVSLAEIRKNSLDGFYKEIWQMLFPNLMMLIVVIYGIAGTTYIYIFCSWKALTVYEMCGQSKKDRINMILFANFLPMLSGVVVSFIMSSITNIREMFSIENIWTIYHVLSTFALIWLFVVVICICSCTMMYKTPFTNFRHNE